MSPESTDDHLALALHHISAAIERLEDHEHNVFAQAAFESRITAYGNHCRRHAVLQHIARDLEQLTKAAA
jgi:hypothetical protein